MNSQRELSENRSEVERTGHFNRCFYLGLLLVFLILLQGCSTDDSIAAVTPPIAFSPTPVRTESKIPAITRPATSIVTQTPQPKTAITRTLSPTSNAGSDLLINSWKFGVGSFFVREDGSILELPAPMAGVQLTDDPCIFYNVVPDWKKPNVLYIKNYDIQGTLLDEKSVTIDPQYYFGYYLHLSLDQNWVSYSGVNGDNAYDPRYSTKKDIYLVDINQNGGIPKKITQNGGAPFDGVAWSPDGRYLGYSDLDASGIEQFYRMDIQTRKVEQLTSFSDFFRGLEVWQVQFSPDGNYIGFIENESNSVESYFGIIRLNDKKIIWMWPTNSNSGWLGSFWWNQDGSQVMAQLSNGLIAWSDIKTGQVMKTFPEAGATSIRINNFFPVKGGEKLIIRGQISPDSNSNGVYLYDFATGSIQKIDFPELSGSPYFAIIPPVEVYPDQCQ